jgi:hypothetical protein
LSEQDEQPSPEDLTGYWSGEYWYDAGAGTLCQFAAHIKDAGGSFDGTTLEAANFGAGSQELTAVITGSREGAVVQFTKRYDAGQRVHREPIFYAGEINSDLTYIEGRWTLKELIFRMNGGFRMQRGSSGAKSAVMRSVEEKAPALVGAGRRKP